MSISLANMRTKLDELIGNVISGTTSADGAADKTTAIDSRLAQYPDDYFKDRFLYMVAAAEERKVKGNLSPSGTVVVWTPFSAQVLADKAYELRLFSIVDEKIALNNALNSSDVFPYFYKRLDDETSLKGKGTTDTEYEVPAAFIEFPDQIWIKNMSGSRISYSALTDVQFMEVGGVKKFYASIGKDKPILLIGKAYLSQFTDDASTTELTDAQAQTICLKAAANLYEMYAAKASAEDAGRFEMEAAKFNRRFDEQKRLRGMSALYKMTLDWDWLK